MYLFPNRPPRISKGRGLVFSAKVFLRETDHPAHIPRIESLSNSATWIRATRAVVVAPHNLRKDPHVGDIEIVLDMQGF